jgi:SM-20-related protein
MKKGWSVQPDYFSPELVSALLDDMQEQDRAGKMAAAAVGRQNGGWVDTEVRNDRTLWLTGRTEAPWHFLSQMETLRRDLNAALYMGLFEYEAHYALYPAGGFYKKHRDSLVGQRNRLISTATYLTPDWQESDGGHLVLYAPDDENREITRVLPRAGTLAVFLSEDIPHEVLPPGRERASIAGWFRCNNSTSGKVDPLR